MDDVQTYKSIERDIKEPSSLLVKNSADYSEDNHFKFQTNPTNKEPSMWRHMNAKKASNMSVSQVATALDADLDRGLTVIEAEIRKKSQGYNEFFVGDPEPLWKKFLEQFKNPLILLLLCSALVSVCMSQFDDAVSIALAVIIVSTVAFVQEYRSEKSLEELSKLLPDYCTCLRSYTKVHSSTFPSTENGPEVITLRIPARELVPGDLVMLMAGDRIPADLRLVKVRDLRVDESGFTGEAHPVKKISDVVNNQNIHLEVESEADSQYHASDFSHVHMKNIGFMGTLIRSGKGMGIVIGTGERTEFGEIFKLMKAELVPKTPLQRSMDRLGKQLSFYSIIIISLIIVLGYIRGRALLEMFTIGVSLAVAAIPEGLPIVVTVTLALGVLRMSKKKVIVKKLPTVETLGRVNVLCSDKTGTLTTNRMTVTDIYLPDEPCFEVKDLIPPFTSSNSPNNSYLNYGNQKFELDKGQILLQPQQNDNKDFSNITSRDETARNLATTAAICSDFSESYASPTETAILDLSKRISKLNGADIRAKYERIREIPFSSERKYMQVICSVKDSYAIPNIPIIIIALKGAPEIILTKCDRFYRCNNSHHGANDAHLLSDSFFAFHENQICPMTDSDRQKFTIKSQSMALNGLRVLGVAFNCHSTHKYPDFESEIKDDMCFNNNIFLGYIGIQDPVKSNVPRVIGSLQKIGIKVKMITGDSKETACSVARNIGLLSNNPIFNQYDNSLLLSGFELDRLMPEQLAECIERIVVFYRTSPIHKIKIVKALQDGRTHKSNVVAMTGDGINDALALKRADIGIAVMSFSPRVSSNPSDISLGNNSIPYNEPRPDNFDLQDTLVNTNDACKEAADMLLLDGDLSTLTICVEEGKTIYENIRNFLRFQLSTSISAMALIALSTMLFMDVPGKKSPENSLAYSSLTLGNESYANHGYVGSYHNGGSSPNTHHKIHISPLNAMQILWINIIMDGPPAQSLGVEPPDEYIINQPPRDVNDPMITRALLFNVILSAFTIVTGTIWVFLREMRDGMITPRDTTMTFTCFVLFDMFNALSCRSQTRSIFSIGFFTNRIFIYSVMGSILAQILVIYTPFFQRVFQTEAIGINDWIFLVALSSSVFWISEIKKFIERHNSTKNFQFTLSSHSLVPSHISERSKYSKLESEEWNHDVESNRSLLRDVLSLPKNLFRKYRILVLDNEGLASKNRYQMV